jgi:hypothetical protein
MLSAALQSGTDPAKLEKLMDLADRWKAQQAAAEFAVALNECQAEMPCVVKDRENKGAGGAKYAALETVNVTVKPVYTRHGFSLSFGTDNSPLEGCIRVVCDVRHVGGHKERYFMDAPPDGAGFKGSSNKTGVQAVGSTISYLRRYLMLNIFNVTVANEDIDGNAADALDAITDEEALQVEDLLIDKQVDRAKFLQWCADGNHLIPGDPAVKGIRKKSIAAVIDILNRKKAPGGR